MWNYRDNKVKWLFFFCFNYIYLCFIILEFRKLLFYIFFKKILEIDSCKGGRVLLVLLFYIIYILDVWVEFRNC